MVVPPGNEGSDGPQRTSPVSRVAPARERPGHAGQRARSRTPARRGGAGLGAPAGLRPPLRHLCRRGAGLRPLRLVLGMAHRAWHRAEFVAGRRPDLPPDLPAAGTDDRLPRHQRGGLRAVLGHQPCAGRRRAARGALHRGARVAVVPRRGGLGHPRGRRRLGHDQLDADGERSQVVRVPHRSRLRCAAGGHRDAGAAQPAGLAGRAHPAPGDRAGPAGVAGRRHGAGPHRAGDARCRVTQHPGDGDPGRRRLRRAGVRPRTRGRDHARGVGHRAPGPDRHAPHARRAAR